MPQRCPCGNRRRERRRSGAHPAHKQPSGRQGEATHDTLTRATQAAVCDAHAHTPRRTALRRTVRCCPVLPTTPTSPCGAHLQRVAVVRDREPGRGHPHPQPEGLGLVRDVHPATDDVDGALGRACGVGHRNRVRWPLASVPTRHMIFDGLGPEILVKFSGFGESRGSAAHPSTPHRPRARSRAQAVAARVTPPPAGSSGIAPGLSPFRRHCRPFGGRVVEGLRQRVRPGMARVAARASAINRSTGS